MIKEQLDAIDRGLVPPGAATRLPPCRTCLAAIADNAPTAEHFRPAPADDAAVARGAAQRHRAAPPSSSRARAVRPDQRKKPGGHYDDDALAVGQVVAELARFGLEGRHLRAFRTAAEREVGLFGQVVGPMSRQRGTEAKARAEETVRELAALSVRLHAALVQIGLRDVIGG